MGTLYADQGKPGKAEKMYESALQGREKALGPEPTSIIDSVHCLAIINADLGKLGEDEKMDELALQGSNSLGQTVWRLIVW